MKNILDLERFLSVQESQYELACQELKEGKKQSHWMWYIFPQIRGLGKSDLAKYYAIQSKQEAIDYLNHPLLSARLVACTELVNSHKALSSETIFGELDALKFQSSMTLFASVFAHSQCQSNPFTQALEQFYSACVDRQTLILLS